ncbi:hypothetical protein [Peribacillus sp. Hz7]|uniref:hypothetical protein n=1 Tax=Peribacillus sp. Hz7 TaxID=3344873 RepID=UPI0035CAB2DD
MVFDNFSQVFTGNVDTWFMEGMATVLQGGVGFSNGPQSSTTVRASGTSLDTWSGEYGATYATVMTLHEMTSDGLAGDGTIIDFCSTDAFLNWFNNTGNLVRNAYLNSESDFDNTGRRIY